MLPRDVDLTLKMDFNKREGSLTSIKLTKSKKDESYKRYNEYEDKSFSSTTSDLLESSTSGLFSGTSTTSPLTPISFFDKLYPNKIIKKEERICWRKVYKDPNIYGENYDSFDDIDDKIRNYNFAMGSKYDRLKIHYQKLKDMENFCGGLYCDCCGKRLNNRNCLKRYDTLCSDCNARIFNPIESVKI